MGTPGRLEDPQAFGEDRATPPVDPSWHTLPQAEAAARLQTDPALGLTDADALDRLRRLGPNRLDSAPGRPALAILADQFRSLMALMLPIAAAAALALGEHVEAVAILIVTALNDAHGTNFDPSFLKALGREVLELEWAFNRAAGFAEADDELPAFFYREALEPTGKTARHHADEVNRSLRELLSR